MTFYVDLLQGAVLVYKFAEPIEKINAKMAASLCGKGQACMVSKVCATLPDSSENQEAGIAL